MLVTLRGAARQFGIDRTTLWRWLYKSHVKRYRIDQGVVLLDLADVERVIEEHRPQGVKSA